MPTWNEERPEEAAERKTPEEPTPQRSAAPDREEPPVAQIGEDPGTVDPESA